MSLSEVSGELDDAEEELLKQKSVALSLDLSHMKIASMMKDPI